MSGIDHRAEAVRLVAHGENCLDEARIAAFARLAQVHATLAGPPTRTIEIVADETARRELDELRAAVRELVAGWDGDDTPATALSAAVARLRALVGGAQ